MRFLLLPVLLGILGLLVVAYIVSVGPGAHVIAQSTNADPANEHGCPSQTGAGGGARGSLVGSVRRRDGLLQVTYAGHPLYHYVGDRRPGQVLCQAVPEFGGTWYVVAPSGNAIR